MPAPAPLFAALFNYRHSTRQPQPQPQGQRVGALAGIEVLHGAGRANYPLVVSVDDLGDGFAVTADAVAPAVPEQVCALLVTALDGLVAALEQAPATPLHQIAVLSPRERAQLLAGWNETAAPVPSRDPAGADRGAGGGVPGCGGGGVRGCGAQLRGAGCAGEPAGAIAGGAWGRGRSRWWRW